MLTINPIIPIWIMAIICVILLFFKRKGVWPYVRQVILIALLFVINLRIMVPSNNVADTQLNMDLNVIFVVDDTISMVADDYAGGKTRLDAVYSDCEYIINELYGARFAVIEFNNAAYLKAPFSDNASYVKNLISCLYPIDEMYATGTTLNSAKDVMLKTLKSAYEKNNGNIIVFYISDGEITDGSSLESYSKLKEYVNGGAVLGYGTTAGGKMKVKSSYSDNYEKVMDKSVYPWVEAVSRINENNLKQIASDLDINYINMYNNRSEIDSVIKEAKKNVNEKDSDTKGAGYVDIYYFFAIPIVIILLFEFIEYRRKR